MPPPNVLLYGVYLLNQNISQYKYIMGLSRGDLRATLANLWDIMNCTRCEINLQVFDNFQSHRHNDCSASSVDSVPLDIVLNVPTLSSDSSPR
jgi:UV radiation resistance-associated gene protein